MKKTKFILWAKTGLLVLTLAACTADNQDITPPPF